jgi:hypothetical protein
MRGYSLAQRSPRSLITTSVSFTLVSLRAFPELPFEHEWDTHAADQPKALAGVSNSLLFAAGTGSLHERGCLLTGAFFSCELMKLSLSKHTPELCRSACLVRADSTATISERFACSNLHT